MKNIVIIIIISNWFLSAKVEGATKWSKILFLPFLGDIKIFCQVPGNAGRARCPEGLGQGKALCLHK